MDMNCIVHFIVFTDHMPYMADVPKRFSKIKDQVLDKFSMDVAFEKAARTGSNKWFLIDASIRF